MERGGFDVSRYRTDVRFRRKAGWKRKGRYGVRDPDCNRHLGFVFRIAKFWIPLGDLPYHRVEDLCDAG